MLREYEVLYKTTNEPTLHKVRMIDDEMEKTIKAELLVNEYCNKIYVMNRSCFMFACKAKGKYARKYKEIWVFHCKLHSTKEHKRIIP